MFLSVMRNMTRAQVVAVDLQRSLSFVPQLRSVPGMRGKLIVDGRDFDKRLWTDRLVDYFLW